MKKIKIVSSGFDKETGISHVTIQTPKGSYTGYSNLQEEDKTHVSQMTGCRYAEIKAYIKMLNAEIKEIKSQFYAFERLYNNISQSNKFNKDSYEARKIRREMYHFKEKIKELENLKFSMHNTLMTAIDERQEKVKNFYKQVDQINK